MFFRYLLLFILVFHLTSCGYHDNLHVRHRMLFMLWNEQYTELDEALTEQYKLYKSGKLKAQDFADQLWSLQMADPAFTPRFEKYTQVMSDSRWAYLAQGLFLIQQAANARGDDVAARTPQDNFERMNSLLLLARQSLQEAERHSAPASFYDAGQIRINMLRSESADSADLVADAMLNDPEIWLAPDIYFGSLYPQWGGSEGEMKDFIAQVKPRHPELAAYLQADFYWRRGLDEQLSNHFDKAIEIYKQAIAIYPHAGAMKNLGELYFVNGECQLAVDILTKLNDAHEWDLWTLEELHQALICNGNTWQARRIMTKHDEYITRYHDGV